MAALSTLIIGATALAGLAGTAVSYVGAQKQQKGAERAERIREAQMKLQADRDRRASIRQAIVARAQATSNASSQGAVADSSLQGGLAQISGVNNRNQRDIRLGEDLGQQMFAANRTISSGQTLQSIGSSIQGFGSTIAQNYDLFKRTGTFATS